MKKLRDYDKETIRLAYLDKKCKEIEHSKKRFFLTQAQCPICNSLYLGPQLQKEIFEKFPKDQISFLTLLAIVVVRVNGGIINPINQVTNVTFIPIVIFQLVNHPTLFIKNVLHCVSIRWSLQKQTQLSSDRFPVGLV